MVVRRQFQVAVQLVAVDKELVMAGAFNIEFARNIVAVVDIERQDAHALFAIGHWQHLTAEGCRGRRLR